MPAGTHAILDRRSLPSAHRRLAELLRPGQRVLDVGCGTGAITRGVAEAIAPAGRAVGIDVNDDLIRRAEAALAGGLRPSFVRGDIYALPFADAFDIVTAARVLQWLARPRDALAVMARATKPGGRVLVLDFNHERIVWRPEPPASMRRFYAAFLQWRSEAGLDNAMADHLAPMFATVGLKDVATTAQHEAVRRGDRDFEWQVGLWTDVTATRGHQMVRDGALTESERETAEVEYRAWARAGALELSMYLLAVEGVR